MVENFTNITTNHMNTNKEEWEIEFDTKVNSAKWAFLAYGRIEGFKNHIQFAEEEVGKLKQFIKTQRTQAKEEERKRIEAEVRELPDGLMVGGQSVTNTGKMSVLQILNKTQ